MLYGKRVSFLESLVLFLLFFLSPFNESPAQMQTPKVGVFKVKEEALLVGREYVGHVEAMAQVEIRAKVQGYIEEIRFKEGSFVKEGQILYILEQAPFNAEVEVAEARLEQAKAELFRATKYLQRLREVKEGGVSQFEMERAMADELKAKADVKLREAELKNAKLNLGYTQVRSPISGKIGQSLFKEGSLVGPSSGPLAKVVTLDPIRIVFSPSERDIQRLMSLKDGQGFFVLLPEKENPIEIPVALDFIDNQVDPSTGTIGVWLRASNPKGILVPGQYVKVKWIGDTFNNKALLIPQASVLQDQKGRYVLVVENGVVKEKRVKLGEMLKHMWIVEEGVSVGDQVIVEGVQKVRPGQEVEVMEARL